jgi:hypothetical protein
MLEKPTTAAPKLGGFQNKYSDDAGFAQSLLCQFSCGATYLVLGKKDLIELSLLLTADSSRPVGLYTSRFCFFL